MGPPFSDEQILALSVRELALAIRCRTVSAARVLQAFRRRAEIVDAACNAVTCYVEEAARWAAEADEHLQRTGQVLGPLHGVPFSIKDHYALQGYPVTMGLAKLREKQAKAPTKANSAVVVALRRAGAIPFCKTNMSQLGDTWGGGNPAYGDTLNPWDTLRTPGGSSCGEGALLGGGGSPFGIGSDVGGSVRIPAAFCGLCALKPTGKRLSMSWEDGRTMLNHPGDYGVPACVGPMARRCEDLVEVMGALLTAPLFRADPQVPPMPLNRAVVEGTGPLRVGWYTEEFVYPRPCAAAARAVELAKAALEAAGHTLVPFRPNSEGACTLAEVHGCDWALTVLDNSGGASKQQQQHPQISPDGNAGSYGGGPLRGERLHPDLVAAYTGPPRGTKSALATRIPRTSTPGLYQAAVAKRDQLRDRFAGYWDALEVDVLLCPVWPYPPPPVEEVRKAHECYIHTRVYNFLDYPAGVLPVTTVSAEDLSTAYDPGTDHVALAQAACAAVMGSLGLPVAVQVVAKPWQEELCLRAMLEVQRRVSFDHTQHARLKPTPRRCLELGGHPELVATTSKL